jgi:hypothetical protein
MKNSKIDNLLESLDAIAAYHNSYEYGLPLYDESVVEEMRNCVLEWINNNNKESICAVVAPVMGK